MAQRYPGQAGTGQDRTGQGGIQKIGLRWHFCLELGLLTFLAFIDGFYGAAASFGLDFLFFFFFFFFFFFKAF
jgi:hypothetical protein